MLDETVERVVYKYLSFKVALKKALLFYHYSF
jgi:hypothetical protein